MQSSSLQLEGELHKQNPACDEQSNFAYNNDCRQEISNIFSTINSQIIQLHEDVLCNVFTDIDYYRIRGILPSWIRDAGNSQESAMSKLFFEKLVKESSSYLVNKCLYYYDCEMLVNALQNRFCIIESMLSQVYEVLTPYLKYKQEDYDAVVYAINEESERVNAYISTTIINMASCCDIITKIAVELSEMSNVSYDTYPKMRSANTIYGSAKKLPEVLKKDNTCFADVRPVIINKIETIRDEIIHNGSLDFNARIYYGNKGNEFEKWILAPSFTAKGTFTSYKGRKKFYDLPTRTWNNELLVLVKSFLKMASDTIGVLSNAFSKKYYDNHDDFVKYNAEIMTLSETFNKVAESDNNIDN